MAWDPLTTAEIASGKAVTTTKITKIKDCLEYLYGEGALLKGSIPNGGFELDADSDGIPDGWTQSLYAGGSATFDTAAPMEGMQSYKYVHPGGTGNGGGTLTSDYLECSEYVLYTLYALHYTSVTGIKDKIQVQYYTKAKVANGSAVDLYNSTACATAPEKLFMPFKPTANSRYLKVVLTGGHTDATIAGNSFFDDINVEKTVTPIVKRCATTLTKSASISLTDVPDLSVNVLAGLTYHFRAHLILDSGSTVGGWRFMVSGTCTRTTMDYNCCMTDLSTPGIIAYEDNQTALGVSMGALNTTPGDQGVAIIEGSIIVATSGTLKIQFAQWQSAIGGVSCLQGSTLTVTPIA
jgi:hypothetical protein